MLLTKKYDILALDPPWKYSSPAGSKKFRGGACNHYQTLSLKDLKALHPARIAMPDSLMFLWGTPPMLPEQIALMEHWGWTYKTFAHVWIKVNKNNNRFFIGCGAYTRANSEIVLLGTRGKILRPQVRNVSQVVMTRRLKHSEKPDAVYQNIDTMYPTLKKVEFFATKRRQGWDTFGANIDGNDIRDYLGAPNERSTLYDTVSD